MNEMTVRDENLAEFEDVEHFLENNQEVVTSKDGEDHKLVGYIYIMRRNNDQMLLIDYDTLIFIA